MKVKVISTNAQRAEQVARMVRAGVAGLDVQSASAATFNGLPAVINGTRPALLVLDGIDAAALDAVGLLAQSHPDVETIVISDQKSPEFLMKAMQAGVREVLPPAVDGPALQAAVQRIARKRAPAQPVRHGEVLAFMACKGGSGASFIAANVADVLSSHGEQSVALLDLDLQFGDALMMLTDQRTSSDVAEVARNIDRLDGDLLRSAMVQVSGTLSVLSAPDELGQELEIKAAHVEAIIRQAQQMFDFVVLDLGSNIGAVSLQALDMAERIFPVVQLNLPSVRDARRLRRLFRSLDYPPSKIHWVVNRYHKAGELTLEALEQALGSKTYTTIPNHFAGVSASVNQGVPIARLARSSAVTRALHDFAQAISPAESAKKNRWLSSLFGDHRTAGVK